MGAHRASLLHALARSVLLARWQVCARRWRDCPCSGVITMLFGILLSTACIRGIDALLVVLPNPGLLYLPLVGMLAYHGGGREALTAALLHLLCVYVFFLPPPLALKPFTPQNVERDRSHLYKARNRFPETRGIGVVIEVKNQKG
jgi:hypothetical protein